MPRNLDRSAHRPAQLSTVFARTTFPGDFFIPETPKETPVFNLQPPTDLRTVPPANMLEAGSDATSHQQQGDSKDASTSS